MRPGTLLVCPGPGTASFCRVIGAGLCEALGKELPNYSPGCKQAACRSLQAASTSGMGKSMLINYLGRSKRAKGEGEGGCQSQHCLLPMEANYQCWHWAGHTFSIPFASSLCNGCKSPMHEQ